MSDKEDSLFILIRSLSPSEKRHFSIYASRHTIGSQNNSLRMFKKLEALKKYNEKEFLSQNKKEGFVKHYGFNKHFLYKLILRSLHIFHAGKTMESELREQLHYIDILSERGLFQQARSLIKTARKKAEKFELHTLLLELLDREMTLDRELAFAGKTNDDIKKHLLEFDKQLTNLRSVAEMETFTARTAMEANISGLVRDKKVFQDLEKLKQDEKLQKPPAQFHAAWHFYSTRVGLHFLTLDHKNALAENELLLELMERSKHFIFENPKHYLSSLTNKMVLLSNFKRYEEMMETVKKIEAVPVRTNVLRNRKFNVCNSLVLQMHAKTGEFEKGLELLETANERLAKKEVQFQNLQFEIAHYLAAANMHFGVGDLASANKYLQEIIDRRDLILRGDILCFSLIMRMIVQFEMQKQDLLEYTVRSVYRFLYKRDRLYKFEEIILNFIRKKAPHIDTQKELVNAFKDLRGELLPLTTDPFEKNAFAYFDVIAWLGSKIDNKPFKNIVQAQYRELRKNA